MRLKIFFIIFLTILFIVLASCKRNQIFGENFVLLTTNFGDIKIKLSDSTPLHRDNFLCLVKLGYYDNIPFHRVINNFMIQAGDVSTKPSFPGSDTISKYTLPPEIVSSLFHKKGAIAAARLGNDINPEIRSSGTQFYIVQGTVLNDEEINNAESQINSSINQLLFLRLLKQISDSARKGDIHLSDSEIHEKAALLMYEKLTGLTGYKIPDVQRAVYKTIGGVPRLDQTYTVFGEVVEGLDIVDKIASLETDQNNRPLSDIKILHASIVKK